MQIGQFIKDGRFKKRLVADDGLKMVVLNLTTFIFITYAGNGNKRRRGAPTFSREFENHVYRHGFFHLKKHTNKAR